MRIGHRITQGVSRLTLINAFAPKRLAPLGCALAVAVLDGCGTTTHPARSTAAPPRSISGVIRVTALPTPNGPPFHFNVLHLTATAGRIEVQLHNAGTVGHNLRIQTGRHCCFGPGYQDLGGTQTIGPGQTTAAIVNLKPGRYFFLCSLAQHWEHHMQGILIVS